MTQQIDYYRNENLELLIDVSTIWIETYNFLKQGVDVKNWEQLTLDQLILSEKVFDV
jgi:hypothetical protein